MFGYIDAKRVAPRMFKGVMEVDTGNPTGNLTAKITNILQEIKAGKVGAEELENVLLLGKTQGTIEIFRILVKGAI